MIAAVCAVAFCLLVGVSPLLRYAVPASANEFGDSFGFMNAFVSACAFTALIVTMFWQREELKLQREELELTRHELQRSAEAQEKTQQSIADEVKSLYSSLTVNIHSQLFNMSFSVHKMIIERPILGEFIYQGRTLDEGDAPELKQQARLICEVFSDFSEIVCLQMSKIEEPNWQGWVEYISDIISGSPQLRQHLSNTRNWITAPAFREVVAMGFRRAGESLDFPDATV